MSLRIQVEVANGLDPFCNGRLDDWVCNGCSYAAAPIVSCDDDLKRVEQSVGTRLPQNGGHDGVKHKLTCDTWR